MRTSTLMAVLFLIGWNNPALAQWLNLGSGIVPANYHSNDIKVAPDGSIWNVSGVNAYPATGTTPFVNRSADEGATWSTHPIPGALDFWGLNIAPIDSMTAWATCEASGLFKTVDGGVSWEKDTAYPYLGFYSHFFTPDSGVVFGADTSSFRVRISLTTDGGMSWTHGFPDSTNNPPGISFPPFDPNEGLGFYGWSSGSTVDAAGDVIVLNSSKGYWISKDRGYNWTLVESPVRNAGYVPVTIAIEDSNTVMIATDYDTLFNFTAPATFATTDGGQTWTQGSSPLGVAFMENIPGEYGTYVIVNIINISGPTGTAITYNHGQDWYVIDNNSATTLAFVNDSVGYGTAANGPFGLNNDGRIMKWEFDCVVLTSNISATACDAYTWDQTGLTYTEAGSYSDTLQSAFGCDSIVVLNLNFIGPSTDVSQNGATLLADDDPAETTHQWLRCDQDYAPIPGAIVTIFTAQESGLYAVELTTSSCTDTSDCYLVCFPDAVSAIEQSGDTLSVTNGEVSYQWLDCNNGDAPIADATEQSFVPSSSGNYAVEITSAIGCVDTLACVNLVLTSKDQEPVAAFQLYPNPAQDRLFVEGPQGPQVLFDLYAPTGQRLQQGELDPNGIEVSQLPAGMYILRLRSTDGQLLQTSKFLKR